MALTLEEKLLLGCQRQPNGCLLWTGSCVTNGYGQMGHTHAFKRKTFYRTHRLAWELWRGPIPSGLNVLHKCDVKQCVEPSHLYLGNQKDNARDASAGL